MQRTSFSWHAIRKSLLQSSLTPGFQRDFDAIRGRHRHLSCYQNPILLLDALHGDRSSPGEKNLVLTALVEAAQSDQPESECALTLMLLALWPGLGGILSRTKRGGLGTVEELASEILAGAIEAIRCLDRDRVRRMAATVIRNVERDLVRACRKEAVHRHALSERDPNELATAPHIFSCEWLRSELDRLVGRDASLVFNIAVEGCSQAEAAVRFRLSESATRKRYQRATRHLRQTLEFA